MKQIKNIVLSASLIVMAGCSADEITKVHDDIPLYELTTPLSVESTLLSEITPTRAYSSAPRGSEIGIFLSGNGYTPVNNRKYVLGAAGWGPTTQAGTIYLGGGDATVCAYYPYASGITSVTIPLESKDASAPNVEKDLRFAIGKTLNAVSNTIQFEMKHAYSRLSIEVERDATYAGPGRVSNLTFSNVIRKTDLNIEQGKYGKTTGDETIPSINPTSGSYILIDQPGTRFYNHCILIPCEPKNGGIKVSLTVDGKIMSTTIPINRYKPVRGTFNKIKLRIAPRELVLSNVTVEDWGNPSNGGDYDI